VTTNVMLDLDSGQLRDMLEGRIHENRGGECDRNMESVDLVLDALRGLAADGLLVRG
jgi:hypothetical protein